MADKYLFEDSRVCALLQQLAAELREQLGTSDATFWLFEPERNTLRPIASARTPTSLFERMATPVDDSVIGLVAVTGMPTIIGPEDRRNPIAETVSGVPVKWMAAAPVHFGEELVGVLSTVQSNADTSLGGRELEVTTWKAEVVGLVLLGLSRMDGHG